MICVGLSFIRFGFERLIIFSDYHYYFDISDFVWYTSKQFKSNHSLRLCVCRPTFACDVITSVIFFTFDQFDLTIRSTSVSENFPLIGILSFITISFCFFVCDRCEFFSVILGQYHDQTVHLLLKLAKRQIASYF